MLQIHGGSNRGSVIRSEILPYNSKEKEDIIMTKNWKIEITGLINETNTDFVRMKISNYERGEKMVSAMRTSMLDGLDPEFRDLVIRLIENVTDQCTTN